MLQFQCYNKYYIMVCRLADNPRDSYFCHKTSPTGASSGLAMAYSLLQDVKITKQLCE